MHHIIDRLTKLLGRGDSGMTTAEYAVGTVAAAAFGVVLYKIVTSSQVSALLLGIIKRALTALS